jgi:fimbrial chaperone protein
LIKIAKIVLFFSFFYTHISYASYEFDKTVLNLSSKRPVDSIKFTNPNKDTPLNLQVKLVRWLQDNGNDVYQQTKDLIAAPPQLIIPPGKSQIIRVGWRNPQPVSKEIAYRMIVTDLTSYKKQANTITLRLQINLPVYIEPDNIMLKAQWQVKKQGPNALKVLISNVGNVHIKISKLTVTNANDEVIASQPTDINLLPGQSKQGILPLNKTAGQTINIKANTDRGNLETTVSPM